MPDFVYLNDKFIEKKDAKISIEDRGFLFGDGLFETCKIVNGKIINFDAHLKRLKTGLKNLKINFLDKKISESQIFDIANELIKKNNAENSLLKIIISRGEGSVGYLPNEKITPTFLIQTLPLRQIPEKINLSISSHCLADKNHSKTLSGLIYVLTKVEAKEKNFFDSVILNSEGFICETSSANIFWIKDKKIYTPTKELPMIKGVVRDFLLKNKQLKIREIAAKISELSQADEIFLTNSSYFILSVDEFGEKKLTNEMTKKLQKLNEKYQN